MTTIYFFDLFGSFAFALSGALMAIKKDMDLFGIIVLALVTAIGGGTTRDILLGHTPVFILTDPMYIYVSIAAALSAFFFYRVLTKINSIILISDAIGLGTFVCIGVSKALDANVSYTGAVVLGVITAIVGGIIRDSLANEIPSVFVRDFYAMTCILGGIIFVLLYELGVRENLTMSLTAGFIITLRLLAIKFNWNFIKASSCFSDK